MYEYERQRRFTWAHRIPEAQNVVQQSGVGVHMVHLDTADTYTLNVDSTHTRRSRITMAGPGKPFYLSRETRTDPSARAGFHPHPPSIMHRFLAKGLGAGMWFFIFYRAR
jgi:hypothetical protein